ncbi:MAG: FeoB-associated Cys-rich membrane protein [Treponema sp.]|nr:FeoB-associated Cys-rich membrane protein [Treponema sp.]
MGTIVISLLLIAVVAMIIRSMIKTKHSGKCSCGGNCGACGGNCHCNTNNNSVETSFQTEDKPIKIN